MMRFFSLWLVLFLVPVGRADEVSFRRDLAPVLVQKCLACHGPKKAKGSYRVDTFEKLALPGDTGEPMITAGKPDMSELFYRLSTDDDVERMPHEDDPLPPEVVTKFKQWIDAGAKFDGGDPKALLATILPPPRHPDPPAKYPRAVPITSSRVPEYSPDGSLVSRQVFLSFWPSSYSKSSTRVRVSPSQLPSR